MHRADNLKGAAFMTASMAGFAVEDVFIKASAQTLPVGQVMAVMGLSGVLVFALLALRASEPAFPRAFLTRPLLIRSGFEVSGRLFYALALALTPLSTTSAILQATPLVVIAGAAILFHERVGPLRWAAVLAGLFGVLIILRPGLTGFSALSLLAVVGMLGFAGRDLATRAAPLRLSNRQLGVAGFAMLGLAGLLVLGWTGGARLPDAREAALTFGACVFGIAAYHALTAAMRTGEVSAVTPFRYTRLVFALVLAVALFGERPDAQTLLGAGLVVVAGLVGLGARR
ncbi:DMT family transporter [Rhodobacter sp. Har01]|uniref:DMT family transporter n=1 Tax=Rhodobacter sp. Har01 TaxID=2883999 RepID=UPI001D07243A|nr:DMT family transporter [Rhodobacter sp. Har01]MCB6179548.1 DMT family transporter [Rhodobacter sp. Har01]